jgi:oligopeptide transport system ATP-binding protein
MQQVGLSPAFSQTFPARILRWATAAIGIACSLSVDPQFIVADEPISPLMSRFQSQIMNLLDRLQA